MDWEKQRKQMVEKQLKARNIKDADVLRAMGKVRRHLFVPEELRHLSYKDRPLPIGHGQTISQPYIVALMTQLADIDPGDKVLEIGTGSGYQAAVLSRLCKQVFSVEIIPELGKESRKRLQKLGYSHIKVRTGDGFNGWKEHAPFERILVTCAPPEIPDPLLEQLAPGGKLVIPVGEQGQELKMVQKLENGEIRKRDVLAVRFVPMTGKGVSNSEQ